MPHILVIEDDLEFREPLVNMLMKDGHTVAVAAHGAEALQLLNAIRADLIITDILMPKMDGIETIVELSRSGDAAPIIAMSGGRRSISADFNLASSEIMESERLSQNRSHVQNCAARFNGHWSRRFTAESDDRSFRNQRDRYLQL